jgi:hypothetical protein
MVPTLKTVSETVGKLFKKILLIAVLREVKQRRLLGDEQFNFRPRLGSKLQPAHLLKEPIEL